MTSAVLETERLVLRKVGEDDVDAHDRVLNTPTVMRHLGGVMPRETIVERHAKVRRLYAEHGFGFLFMIEKATGELAGYAGLKLVDAEQARNMGDHEIGWLVREDRWRMGYAREAAEALIAWAFESIGAPHVVALTSAANEPSWQLMEKLGMARRPDLDFADPNYPPESNPTIQYSLTRAQWESRQP
jgi:RimJ/RimL family protein N-acetyltransferase